MYLNALLSTENGVSGLFETPKNSIDQVNTNICSFFKVVLESNRKLDQQRLGQKQQIIKKKQIHGSDVTRNSFHSFLEKNLDSIYSASTSIYPVRILQDIQNADFLAGEIVYLLQKRAHFRQIQSLILRKVISNPSIKGIRLSCSGRVGGRSKKAQKSKTQSVQWGETSLHVFSSKLDFANKSASTLFGKVGVKVWLCYK